jgi:predicted nucleic acid-binding protein
MPGSLTSAAAAALTRTSKPRQTLGERAPKLLLRAGLAPAAHLPGGLRTLDAVHVASAQILGDSLDTLLTYDRRMLEVAQAAGLPAEAPGLV